MLAPDPTACAHDKPYWDGAREGRFRLQRGTHTGRFQFFPRAHSIHGDEPLEWVDSAGLGTVHTFTVVERSFYENLPAPFVLAVVDLDEGVRATAHVVDIAARSVHIGMRVRAGFAARGAGLPVLVFRPE